MDLAFLADFTAYRNPMADDAHLILKIETGRPIELAEFVGSFVGIGNQFEQFQDQEHPDDKGGTRFYVREVRAGSIIAELVPMAVAVAGPPLALSMTGVKYANDLAKFVDTFGGRLKQYFRRGGREPKASKGDLADYLKAVQAIAHDSAGRLSLAAYEDGKQRAVFAFDTPQAREAEANILEHRSELDATTAADHSRVLLRFVRPSAEAGKPGRKGGERAIIDKISPTARAVLYASDLAEQRMKHELTTAEGNVFKLLFDVDVNVEMSAAGRPLAYRITAMHAVVESDEEPGLL
jgi:hypothetical protein